MGWRGTPLSPGPNQPATSTTRWVVAKVKTHRAPPPRPTMAWLARFSPGRKFTCEVSGGAVPHG